MVIVTVNLLGCGTSEEPSADLGREVANRETPAIHFVDVAEEVGLGGFLQVSGDADKLYLTGSTGAAGVALFDYDLDGALDIFLLNGSRMGGFDPGREPTNRLYKNLGDGKSFEDVTEESGLLSYGSWGQGCAVADVDGNGYPDLYVTNYGNNALFLNRGDGTFREVAEPSGVAVHAWSTGATFIDFDRDGDLDLYVANFVRYEEVLRALEGKVIRNQVWKGLPVAAGPRGLPAAGDRLFRQVGSGVVAKGRTHPVFEDVSAQQGISSVEASYGFQPVVGDYDGDGWLDLFVANDSRANFLWRNLEGGGFRDTGLASGVACSQEGLNQASMGVTFEDIDGDGWLDLFVTNFADDFNTLYMGDGSGFFLDSTASSGLWEMQTKHRLAWGTFFFDADNDGVLELFVANGHVFPQIDSLGAEETFAQANQLFQRKADGRFRDISSEAGPGFAVRKVSRGAAMGDLDNDGDLDIVINNVDSSPTVLRNDSQRAGSWIKVQLIARAPNLSAIGARVRVETAVSTLSRYVRSSESFLSHHDLRLHFGLGSAERVDRLVIDWPDGTSETLPGSRAGVLLLIEQGQGVISSVPLG